MSFRHPPTPPAIPVAVRLTPIGRDSSARWFDFGVGVTETVQVASPELGRLAGTPAPASAPRSGEAVEG